MTSSKGYSMLNFLFTTTDSFYTKHKQNPSITSEWKFTKMTSIHKLSVRKYIAVGTKTMLCEAEQQNPLRTLGLFLSWTPSSSPPHTHTHTALTPACVPCRI